MIQCDAFEIADCETKTIKQGGFSQRREVRKEMHTSGFKPIIKASPLRPLREADFMFIRVHPWLQPGVMNHAR
jgi:hypothetical protein